MEEKQNGLKHALGNAAIKAGWGILVTTMALPTAWLWATTLNHDGIFGAAIALCVLGCVALSPLAIGCAFASDDLRKALRIWRASRPQPRPRNHRTD